jgi:hypothetical protein
MDDNAPKPASTSTWRWEVRGKHPKQWRPMGRPMTDRDAAAWAKKHEKIIRKVPGSAARPRDVPAPESKR